jgi:2-polyprenyl-3-methyl-5-hydroxy-6-metoxy-1,4-benzoquinol methylase
MDDPDLPADVHQQALIGLARLNLISGVSGKLYRHLRRLAKRDGVELQITTTDISDTAVEAQLAAARQAGVKIDAIEHDCLKNPLPNGFDVVACSLFMHHLERHQACGLMQSMQQATEGTIMVCDLDRTRLNLAMVAVASRIVTRSPIVHFDATASVRGAFTMQEFENMATESLSRPVRIRRSRPNLDIMTADEVVVGEKVTKPSVAFA